MKGKIKTTCGWITKEEFNRRVAFVLQFIPYTRKQAEEFIRTGNYKWHESGGIENK